MLSSQLEFPTLGRSTAQVRHDSICAHASSNECTEQFWPRYGAAPCMYGCMYVCLCGNACLHAVPGKLAIMQSGRAELLSRASGPVCCLQSRHSGQSSLVPSPGSQLEQTLAPHLGAQAGCWTCLTLCHLQSTAQITRHQKQPICYAQSDAPGVRAVWQQLARVPCICIVFGELVAERSTVILNCADFFTLHTAGYVRWPAYAQSWPSPSVSTKHLIRRRVLWRGVAFKQRCQHIKRVCY